MIEKKEGVHSGDWHRDSSCRGAIMGETIPRAFAPVASVGAGEVITTVQGTKFYPSPAHPYRVRAAAATASTITGAATFDVYDTEGTPATILSAPKALGAVDVIVSGVVADQTKVYAAGYPLTLRCTTAASTGALANFQGFLEIELYPA